MKRIVIIITAVVLALVPQSCGDEGGGGGGVSLPNISGSTGEVLVVTDKAKWESRLGSKIREVIAAPIDYFPQPEPQFDLINVSPGAFGKLYQTHRNVIFIETGADREKGVTFQENTWAYSQLIINLRGRNDEEIISLLEEEGQTIINKINVAERDRWIRVYKKSLNSMIFNKLRDEYNMILHIPSNFSLDVEEKGFLWFSYETPTTTQAILVHFFDHNGRNYFNEDSIIRIRNNMTEEKVKGPVGDSYMVIEERMPVKFRLFSFRQRNYAEMRGLWTLENGFMGGPFVNLVTRDEVNDRFVMIDGFVYAPKDEKRELLRQVEAIIYTIGFPDDAEKVVADGE